MDYIELQSAIGTDAIGLYDAENGVMHLMSDDIDANMTVGANSESHARALFEVWEREVAGLPS